MALFNNIQNALGSMLGKPLAGNVGLLVDKYLPRPVEQVINKASGIINAVANGNFESAAGRIAQAFGVTGEVANLLYFNTPTPMFGGVTPLQALEIYHRQRGNLWCKKNLWILEVSSALTGDDSDTFNLFAYNLEFAPITISGEKKQIGAAHVDLVNSADPVELSMTALDNEDGFIKAWFEKHGSACANQDGTVGLPADYAIDISVIHGFIVKGRGYKSKGKYRVGNMSLSLSRHEDALSEITLSFVQLDTFMS